MKPTRRLNVSLATETGMFFFLRFSHLISSSSPLLVSEGGGLVCESVDKANLLSDHFESKQSREAVDPQLTCLG